MAQNYVLLETIQLSQSAASVTFDNLPTSGYTDLKIVASTRGAASGVAEANTIYFNGDTTNANYPGKRLLGSGSAASSDQTTTIKPGFFNNLSSSTANTFSNSEVYIPNYTGSNSKSYSVDTVTENNATESYMAFVAGRWTGTAAITSITFTPESGNNFLADSTFSLHGIAALNTTPVFGPFASGGNIVTNDGTYWYHAFLTSGSFTPLKSLSCDVLTIAGGGGGAAGGGGAGGLLYSSSNALSTSSNYVLVGAGGAGRGSDLNGFQGSNSQFGSLTAAIGGGFGAGGAVGIVTGGAGGNGGGAGAAQGSTTITASGGTGSQGFNGGSLTSASRAGGGGAGAGQNGFAGSTNTGGVGGAGINTYSSWHSATNTGVSGYIAGGGGGTSTSTTTKAGGVGGGGAGGGDAGTEAVAGTASTGSGGGGSRTGTGGRSGGSGIVIIRYAMV